LYAAIPPHTPSTMCLFFITVVIVYPKKVGINHEPVIVSFHGTLKLENRNWKFGLHAFILLMNAFNFRPSFSIIALYSVAFDTLYSVAFDTDKTFFLISFRISPEFLLSNFPAFFSLNTGSTLRFDKFQAVNGYELF